MLSSLKFVGTFQPHEVNIYFLRDKLYRLLIFIQSEFCKIMLEDF